MQASTCPVAPAGICRLQDAASCAAPAGCLLPRGAAGVLAAGGCQGGPASGLPGHAGGSDTCTLPEHQRVAL